MKPAAILLIVAALASGCADAPDPAPAPAPPAPPAAPDALPTAAKLPRVVYYVISEA